MSINYYIHIKNKYNLLLFSIDEIIENYKEMIYLSINESESVIILKNDISNFIKIKNIYEEEKENIISKIQEINNNIRLLCQHNFIEDTIDIDPDRCKVINYCQYCGFCKQ